MTHRSRGILASGWDFLMDRQLQMVVVESVMILDVYNTMPDVFILQKYTGYRSSLSLVPSLIEIKDRCWLSSM